MRFVFLFIFFSVLNPSFGQSNYSLQIIGADKPKEFFTKKFSYRTQCKDSLQAVKESSDLLLKLRSFGYAAASIDSVSSDSVRAHIYMYVGEKFENIILQNGNVDASLLNSVGAKRQLANGKPISISEAEAVKARIVRECENSGYPFASVHLDSFVTGENLYSAKIFLQKNDLLQYDSIHIVAKTKTKRAFLVNYLGLKLNKPYNEANIKLIKQRLNELQFVEQIQPHTVLFSNGKARVNLFLKDRKASQFDLLIGMLPGSSGKKVLITGNVFIDLVSMFGMGEEFYLQWQSLQPKTQQLDVRVSYPYLIGLPLGISAQFQLYKRDTTYLDLNGDYGIKYQIIGSNYLKASLRQHITIVTNVDTTYIKNTRSLPQNLDVTANDFALEYFLQKLDYRFNPVSGYVLKVGGTVGAKQIKKNNIISGLHDELTNQNFNFLYDTFRLKTIQFRVEFSLDKYWKLAARHTIKTSLEGKYFYNRNILTNDKYRLGGVNSLRGFDEQSIFTPYYAMANLEYRFLLSKNSFFSAFFNSAVVEDSRIGKTVDFPFGFGAGAAIETKAGIFGITYAVGRQLGNKITFNSSKIHFGYVNYF